MERPRLLACPERKSAMSKRFCLYTVLVLGVLLAAGMGLTAGNAPARATLGLSFNAKSAPHIVITRYPIPSGPPMGVTLGPAGNVWFSESTGTKLGRVTPEGVVTE